ncbi:glycosyl transferase [Gordonia terrae]|uniref:Glycosyl transferase n=1 Tax=Gordonia terrae TaxID=2055 RepID=A0A2I1R696_9ACTN|nr:nucleotide disphospho-sugar-binding domain-containing protein [Gordonia terrae]PKZ64599.1 glycosyl transferase [Gordonia terrae]
MSTYLMCSTPLAGHVGPVIAVGRTLVARGHTVIVVTGSRFTDQVAAAGMIPHPLDGTADLDERDPDSFTPDRDRYRGLTLSRYQVQCTFIDPLADQARAVDSALRDHDVDAVLCDGTFAGIIPLLSRPASRRPPVLGLGTMPLAQTSPHVAPFNSGLRPMNGPAGRMRNRLAHLMVRRVLFASTQRRARELVRAAGGSLDHFVLDLSRAFDRFVQLGPAEFEYPRPDLPAGTVFAGPVLDRRAQPPDDARTMPPWWSELLDDDRPIVHVTQGTLDNHDFSQLVEPTLTGLADMDVRVVVSTGGADPRSVIPTGNATISRYLDYDALLPRTSVMITNGGYGGVLHALSHSVPVVVAPGGEDKPEVAARVRHFGVGVDLATRRPSPRQISDAVASVLADDELTGRCARMARAIAAYDPARIVSTQLDHMITANGHPTIRTTRPATSQRSDTQEEH